MKGLFLFLTAAILGCIFLPIGFVYTILKLFYEILFKRLGRYLFVIAIAIDQLGNVVMQDLFNDILISKNGHKFGNEDETISSVIGKNERLETLIRIGNKIDNMLNFFEKNHSLKAIEENETGNT